MVISNNARHNRDKVVHMKLFEIIIVRDPHIGQMAP